MSRDCEERSSDRDLLGHGGFDDQVFFAVNHRPGVFGLEQPHARSGGVGCDRLVAQVQAKTARRRTADNPGQEQRSRCER